MSRSRFVRDRRAVVRLTDRDRDIVAETFNLRLATKDHLIGLGYASSPSRCTRVMRRLFDAGLVRRIYPSVGSFGVPAIYGIGAEAAPIIADRFGVDPRDVVRLALKDMGRMFVEHTLMVTAVRVAFHQETSQRDWSHKWTPEWRALHAYSVQLKGRWVGRILRPDAYVRVRTAFGTVGYLIEADRSNTSRGRWQATVSHYVEHAGRGLLKGAFGLEHVPVLTITTGGPLRLRHLMDAAPRGSSRFLFATWDAVEREGIFGPIWHTRATSEVLPLLSPSHTRYSKGEN